MKKFLFLLCFYTYAYGSSSYLGQWLNSPSLVFSEHSFDALTEEHQLQILRDYFYSLPLEPTEQSKEALKWLKKRVLTHPSLAYIAARVLKDRNYTETIWKFFAHLAIFYIEICESLCISKEELQGRSPSEIMKNHAEKSDMLTLTDTEAKSVLQSFREWAKDFNWISNRTVSWIFCLEESGSWIPFMGYNSITYTPHRKEYSSCFRQIQQGNIWVIEEKYKAKIKKFCETYGVG
ncbi:hypothetical protein COB28_02425 [Candidatus Dependentiae bacterium]|nr:MAG: hypothetical protein COB28_02425 [Candidatus Dependentiae bacterium]